VVGLVQNDVGFLSPPTFNAFFYCVSGPPFKEC